ncbi:MAG: TetR family transcriptional regulator [Burkholderiales bacterium]|nr:MAG: TetR family transcriptional regulator [Burkholderiales bacterium]
MENPSDLRERIVDTALALAEGSAWERVRLFDVAAELGITLDEVRQHFREKEDVAEAWFDRADAAMLRAAARAEIQALPPRERLHRLIMAWLGALAPHRRVTRQIIYGKLEPGHVHIQVRGLLRVSRTVQWIREGARREAAYLSRALEETVTTSIYLATFFYWMHDDSANSASTSRFLDRLLTAAEGLPSWVFARPTPPRETPGEAVRTEPSP